MIYSKYRSVEDPLYYPVVTKQDQRFWKRILIVDDNEDVITTFKVGIEDSNKSADASKRIEVHTSNNPVLALSEFKSNFYDLLLVDMPHMPQRTDLNCVKRCWPSISTKFVSCLL
jgi:hypothetical protein